jgi:hypothetical protein
MLAARMTLPHFSVSSATSLPKSDGPRGCRAAKQRDELPPLNSIRSGGLQFSLGQKLRMIALHKSQQPVATTSSFFIRLFRELVGSSS